MLKDDSVKISPNCETGSAFERGHQFGGHCVKIRPHRGTGPQSEEYGPQLGTGPKSGSHKKIRLNLVFAILINVETLMKHLQTANKMKGNAYHSKS